MTDYEFKPGTYKMRNGRNATIYETCDTRDMLLGVYSGGDGRRYPNGWQRNGRAGSAGIDDRLDLMPPSRTLWINVYKDGSVVSHETEELAIRKRATDGTLVTCIAVKIPV